jgi:hypothetical protein
MIPSNERFSLNIFPSPRAVYGLRICVGVILILDGIKNKILFMYFIF